MKKYLKLLVIMVALPLSVVCQNKVKLKKNNVNLNKLEQQQLQDQRQLQKQLQFQHQDQDQNQSQKQFQRTIIHNNDSSLIVVTKELFSLYNTAKTDVYFALAETVDRATIASNKYSEFVIKRLMVISVVWIILFIWMWVLLKNKRYTSSYIVFIIVIILGIGIWLDSDHIHLIENADYVIFKEINSFFINK